MELVKKDNPILSTKCESFDFENPPFDPIEFAHEIMKFMYENNGLGLAANQIGVPYRIFAMRGAPENFVCFNPKMVGTSLDTIVLEEGCLTYPGLLVKVKRPSMIRVRFNTPNGATETRQFIGMSARVFQHEMDHLDGIKFFERANKFHKDQAFKKQKNSY
jgi:peptide deformylase